MTFKSVDRLAVLAAAFALATGAFAFDSAEWLGKRAMLACEAERLEAAYTDCVARLDAPAEDVRVPVACHPDGSVKTFIQARRAQIFVKRDLIWAEDVAVRDFGAGSVTTAVVTAENCLVDRNSKSGWVNGRASAAYDGTTLSGSRVYLSSAEQYVSVFSNAVLVTEKFAFKGRAASNVTTRVSAGRADYDRGAGVVMLEGSVQVEDPEYHIASEQAFVFLEGTNGLKRVVALGGVAVRSGQREGSCDRAVYDRAAHQLTLFADPAKGVAARIADRGERKGELEGAKITFRPDDEQVEIENAVIRVETGRGSGLGQILGGER